jgi:SAM-dependent methyltransferase
MDLSPAAFDVVLGRWSLIYLPDVKETLARLRQTLVPGGRLAVTAWAPPETNPWITIPMQALATVIPLQPPDPRLPGLFHLSPDGALAQTLRSAGFHDVHQERVQLSQFARDRVEYWAMLTDMTGPLAPLLTGLAEEERAAVLRAVSEGIERFRVGDVYRIPAQAQLAWGEA